MDDKKLDVGSCNIGKLFEKELKIPSYQRPYVWSEDNVNELIDDIKLAIKLGKENYLIGNVIFHKENENFNIVDGQQRLTTIDLILEENKLEHKNINSGDALKNNEELIKKYKKQNKIDSKFIAYLKKSVLVTYIATTDLDEAFVLFNSQNTRGKSLDDKDLLKGHHIRFVQRKQTQKECAIEFENALKTKINDKDVFTQVLELIAIIKAAVRGKLWGDELGQADIYTNFKSEFLNSEIVFDKYHSDFTLTSSIQGGLTFFKYLQKYANFYLELCKDESFTCYDRLWGGNAYLNKIYKALLLFYHDKFSDDSYEAEKCLQIILLNLRLINERITKKNVASQMKNLFIDIAFASNKIVVIDKLKKQVGKINSLDFNTGNKWQKECFFKATYFKDEIEREFKENKTNE